MMRLILTLATLLCLFLPQASRAQSLPGLFADSIFVTADQNLVAMGNVELITNGTTLKADKIVYNSANDSLQMFGEILLLLPDGTVIAAEQADLEPSATRGLILGARVVLNERLQIAANRVEQVDTQYSHLYKVAATSCNVCDGRAPLWELRAEEMINDSRNQQLHLRDAQLRVRGVPIFWLPRLRFPEPGTERLSGLLAPRFRSSSKLGFGVQTPYFHTFGSDKDLTVTPFVSTETRTVLLRYREQTRNGQLEFTGAASEDALTGAPGFRSYGKLRGSFQLPQDWRLDLNWEEVSDATYLDDYGYSSPERLESFAQLTRVRSDELITARISHFQGLLPTITSDSRPQWTGQFDIARHYSLPNSQGMLDVKVGGLAFARENGSTPQTDRDVARLTASADWQNQWISDAGLVFSAQVGAEAQLYKVWDDPAYENTLKTAVPYTQWSLRWPLHVPGPKGVNIVTPVIAASWSELYGDLPPNDTSTRSELDWGNLFSVSQFAGQDAHEEGWRVAAGVEWYRKGALGVESRLNVGTLYRQSEDMRFSGSTGLSGTQSDYVVSAELRFPTGLSLSAHSLFDSSFTPSRSEARARWQTEDIDLSAAYVFLSADEAENRPEDIWEWALDSSVALNDTWRIGANGRYDIADNLPAEAGLDLEWRNECLVVAISASRRFATSSNLDTNTDFGVSVELAGFSAGDTKRTPKRSCRN